MNQLEKDVTRLAEVVKRGIEIIGEDRLSEYQYCNEYPEYQQGCDDYDTESKEETPVSDMSLFEVSEHIDMFYCYYFIENGYPKFPSRDMIKECAKHDMSLSMYAGETDSCGWLSGCLDITLNDKQLPTMVCG